MYNYVCIIYNYILYILIISYILYTVMMKILVCTCIIYYIIIYSDNEDLSMYMYNILYNYIQ